MHTKIFNKPKHGEMTHYTSFCYAEFDRFVKILVQRINKHLDTLNSCDLNGSDVRASKLCL